MPLGDWDGPSDPVDSTDPTVQPQMPQPQVQPGEGEGEGEGGEPDFRALYKRKDRENRRLRERVKGVEQKLDELLQGRSAQTSYSGYATPMPQNPIPQTAGVPTPVHTGDLSGQEQQLIAQWQQIARDDSDRQVEAFTAISQITAQAAARRAQRESYAAYEHADRQRQAWSAAVERYPDVADRNSELFELANEIYLEEMTQYQRQDPDAQFVAVERAAGRLGYRKGSKKAPPKPPASPQMVSGAQMQIPPGAQVVSRDDLKEMDKTKRTRAVDALAQKLARETYHGPK